MRETDRLDLYLAEERAKPFEWSSRANGDCLLFLLGWAERLGLCAATHWRGAYACETGARMALHRFGGELVAITEVLGPPRMGSSALRGDIGLMTVRSRTFGVISTGGMWAFRAIEGGVGFCRLPVDTCWNTRFSS